MAARFPRPRNILYALKGLAHMWREEANARLYAVATVLVVVLGLISDLNAASWGLLLLTIALVWAAEAMNTAVERLADRVSQQQDPLIAKAKDLAAASVLCVALGAVAVAMAIFVPALL